MNKKTLAFIVVTLFTIVFVLSAQSARDKKIDECQPLLKAAQELHTKKDTDGAIKKINEAIKKVPDYHNFYNILAFLYSTKKDYKNQYLSAKKTVELYEIAKKNKENRNMTDLFYMNLGAAAVNYSYECRQKNDFKTEVALLKEGLKNFKAFASLVKTGRERETALDQIKTIEKDLLPRAEKKLKEQPKKSSSN
jgi:hypothetical protein